MIPVTISGRKIGPDCPVFIMAEAGVNHNGSLERAYEHIRKAKKAGCDAIKFQTYTAKALTTKKAPKYWDVGDDGHLTQFETFSKLDAFSIEYYRKCVAYAKKIGIIFFSTPFDLDSVDLLEKIRVPAYKIASADITFFPLLKKIAKTKKPIILSTGASTLGEIEEAVEYIKSFGNDKIILLHCILSYPTDAEDSNLLMIDDLRRAFPDIPIGFSDHTFHPLTPAFAVMRGACVIEKHYTVDKSLPDSPDHKLGVDPQEMKMLVDAVRLAEKSLGAMHRSPLKSEQAARKLARRSLTSAVDIKKGTIITEKMLIGKRPGTGIPTKFMDAVVGRTARRDIPEDTTLQWNLI
ncbi:MAG: N-acetylneuraminate synthase family protein [Patescibacteria group bacterium]